MFRGRYYHTIDAKGRTSLPSRFREALQAAGESNLVITNFYDECLVAYPFSGWQELEQRIGGLSMMREEVVAFQRFFISGASECSIDKLGRILLPPPLREYSGLDKEIVFVGLVKKFEIWDKARWEEKFRAAAELAREKRHILSELGV
jgi:MraZ protein